MYQGLPQQEQVIQSSSISGLESPKSVILIFPQRSNRMFSNLMSRKRMLFLWRQSRPLRICSMTYLACPQVRVLVFWRQEQRLPLGQYSRPKTMQCLVSKAQSRSMRLSCLMLKRIFFQFQSIFTFLAVVMVSFLMNFKAQYCRSNRQRARYTCENPPDPRNFTISKSQNSKDQQEMGLRSRAGARVSSRTPWSMSCWKVAVGLLLISQQRLQLKGTVQNPTKAQKAVLLFSANSCTFRQNSLPIKAIRCVAENIREEAFLFSRRRVTLTLYSPKLSSSVDWNCSRILPSRTTLRSALKLFQLGVEMQLNMADFSQGVPRAVLLTRYPLPPAGVVFLVQSRGRAAVLVSPLASLRGSRQERKLERSQSSSCGRDSGEVSLRSTLADFDLLLSIWKKGIITIQILFHKFAPNCPPSPPSLTPPPSPSIQQHSSHYI